MLKQETIHVKGVEITCSELPAMAGFRVAARVMKVAGPALVKVVESVDISKLDFEKFSVKDLGEIDLPGLVEAIPLLAEGVINDPDLVVALLSTTSVKIAGQSEILIIGEKAINDAFNGRMSAMLAAIKLSLKLSISDLFDGGLAALSPKGQAEEKAQS